jgi:hypothetical protein
MAEKLLEWAQPYDFVHMQQIYQFGPSPIRDVKTATRICGILKAHGYFIPVPGGMSIDGVKRKIVWRVRHG